MLELLQFRHSPYNEKVRWVLDLKQLPHRRRSLLPGPHVLTVRRLTGRTATPILIHDGTPTDGSARIVAWLEAHQPTPPLLPSDPRQREEALGLERWFDEELTPRIRRPVLDAMLRRPAYFARVFGEGAPEWRRRLYALSVPLAASLVRRGNGITGPEAIRDGLDAVREGLAFVAGRGGTNGYLVGDALSVADIAAASSLAMVVRPPRSPMACVEPVSPEFAALMRPFAEHPGAAWVRATYACHRGASADFDGNSPGPGESRSGPSGIA